ncbi:MAG: PRD domain-containing protein [Anaerolineae bacterium]|nr:PRD domain-containing protein [Anaerolineae bacterium]
MKLDALHVSIILALLESKRPLSTQYLAERVGVSARIVRYRLPLLQAWLARRGVELIIKPRMGLSVSASWKTLQSLRAELQQMKPHPLFRSDERVVYLLFLLLVGQEQTKLEALQAKLGVSRATLLRDLRHVESLLNKRGMIIRRQRRQSFHLLGSELTRRHWAIEILLQSHLNEALTELCTRGKISVAIRTSLQQALLSEIEGWNLYEARSFITRVERELNLALTDDDLLFLTLYWALTLQRMQNGYIASKLDRKADLFISDREFACLETLITSYLGNVIPKDEIFHFLIEIKACQGELTVISSQSSPLAEREISRLVTEEMLKRVGDRLGYDLCFPDILNQMTMHLTRALRRIQVGLPLYNPLTQEVRRAYHYLWILSLEVVRDVEVKYGIVIPEEEVAYLVMYLALAVQLAEQARRKPLRVVVACPSGGIMARLLVYRLQNALPEIEILASVPIRRLACLDLSHVDLIITTVKMTLGRVPVLTVNPLLGEEELQRIRNYLAQLHTRCIVSVSNIT